MGRIYAVLDPDGYYRVDEPGFHWSWSGRKILEGYSQHEYHKRFAATFHNPPDSDWILPTPRQWQPDWYRSSDFANSVMGLARWGFASGLSATTFEPSKVGGETGYSNNVWISVPYIPSGTTSLDATSYANLGTAAGVSLSGFLTAASASTTPLGGQLEELFHPYWQIKHFPEPHNKVVLGWGRFAFLLTGSQYFMLETPDGGRQAWRLIASGTIGGSEASTALKARSASGSLVGTTPFYAVDTGLLVLPVGPDTVYLHFTVNGKAEAPIPVKLETPLRDLTASWWIGAAPGQHLAYQCQVVTYPNSVELPGLPIAGGPYLWDLGGDYLPTLTPSLGVYNIINTLFASDVVVANDGTTYTSSSAYSNQSIQVQFLDESGFTWVSDGTHTKGTVRVSILPGNHAPNGRYNTPQLRRVEMRFAPKLTPRANSSLTLDDTQYSSWMCETAYRDTLGKQGELRFPTIEDALMTTALLDHRGSYPIHFIEDLDGDGVLEPTDPIRAAGWVTSPDVSVVSAEDTPKPGGGTRALPIQQWAIKFGPLLKRADTRWIYLPQMVDPDHAYVEHGAAIAEGLFQKGFDITDPDRVFVYPDPLAGSNVSRLPGGPNEQTGEGGVEAEPPYRPKSGQKALAWMETIRDEWSGWALYERLDGQVNYHPDLILELLYDAANVGLGAASARKYFRSASVYLSQSAATTASVPGQYVLALAFDRSFQEPTANLVRVNGKPQDGSTLPGVHDKDEATWTTVSNENFVGDIIPDEILSLMAVSPVAMMKVARMKLTQKKRRVTGWQETVKLAPWEFTNPVDVGKVVELVNRGDYLVSFLRVEQVARGKYRTRITGEKIPTGATRSLVAGGYPGAGA